MIAKKNHLGLNGPKNRFVPKVFLYHMMKGKIMNKKNFLGKIDKLDAKLEVGRSRNLSILGICLITKRLGIPQLVFSMSILDTPKSCIPTINTSIFQFIWKKKER